MSDHPQLDFVGGFSLSVSHSIDDPWCRHLPLLHRMMANPGLVSDFPRVGGNLELEEAASIWETLHYLFKALLGWTDPGAGLAWWYSTGRDTTLSPQLALVEQIWNSVGKLDYYAGWAWNTSKIRGTFPTEDWWRDFYSRPRQQGHNPYDGGTNPLHLGHSDDFGWEQASPNNAKLHLDRGAREAVLIVNHLGSWRQDLKNAEKTMPNLGERSWHVEIFDRKIGFLGKFRRSRKTGLWFQGKHGIHLQGQPNDGEGNQL